MDELWKPEDLAEIFGTSVQVWAARRHKGTGPNFVKLGRRIYYRRADVEKWIESNVRSRTDVRA